jgi:hypothetical protein
MNRDGLARIGCWILMLLATFDIPSAVWSFDLWTGAGDFAGIIPGWPIVAISGVVWSIVLLVAAWRGLTRWSYRLFAGTASLLVGLIVVATAIGGFSIGGGGAGETVLWVVGLIGAPALLPIADYGGQEWGTALMVALGVTYVGVGLLLLAGGRVAFGFLTRSLPA